MTPKEKAQDLFNHYYNFESHFTKVNKDTVKKFCHITADEAIESWKETCWENYPSAPIFQFWLSVKEEIDKL